MSNFITWNKSDDDAFRNYYFATTGEKIQDEPRDLGDRLEVGSSRISESEIAALLQFSGVTITSEPTF